MLSNRSDWFSSRRHWTVESHLNSRRYHFVLLILTCPPVVSAAPEKSYRTDWDSLIVSAVGFVGDGDIWIMVESSTKKYPTSR